MMPIPGREVHERASKAAHEAAEALYELLMTQKGHFERVAASLGLSVPLAGVLWHLNPECPLSMGALAERMHCDASNITALVDKLETRNAVQRQPSSEDRRVKLLAVTPEGATLREQLLQRIREPAPWILELDEADQRMLSEILRRALAKLPSGET